jgi:hypothetical protein
MGQMAEVFKITSEARGLGSFRVYWNRARQTLSDFSFIFLVACSAVVSNAGDLVTRREVVKDVVGA